MPAARAFDYAILAVGVAAVSTAAIFIREADAPALIISAYRLVLASAPMLLFAALRGETIVPRDGGRLGLTVLAGLCLALHFAFWVASVQQTSVVTSVVLVTTAPLFVALASGPLLGEPPGRTVWIGLGIAAVGTLVMVSEDFGEGGDTLRGDLYALLGAVLAAAIFLIGRRMLAGGGGWLGFSSATYGVAAVLLVGMAAVNGEAFFGYSERTYVFMVLLALVPQIIGHTAINRSLGYLPAFAVALSVQGEPVGATLMAAAFLDELPSALQVGGGLLVLTGVYLGLRSERRPAPVSP